MTQNNEQASAPLPAFTMPNSLKVLTDTIEEFKVFKREQGERLKNYMEQLRRLHTRLETSEIDNRRLKAQVQSLESDNKRLNRENEVLLRTQQTMDSAIHLACGTFHETAQFVADATRMSMPTMPGSFAPEAPTPPLAQHLPELSLVKRQPVVTAKAPLDNGSEVRTDAKPLEALSAYQAPAAQTSPAAAELEGLDSVEEMSAEIDRMLALEFRDLGNLGDDIGARDEAVSGEESKAA